ncbi:hypothetical protein AMAG_08715 [Allomyces macrogynus ATCC 38327]|uniref:Uncharacterized protein n=1 Tax=Allomyces macrogynus (strain ATCC 38327) TaxID=578462 RepID=A0A0L0SML2_ALLM3|nr:hypothetical protein AMAG_08715 [Allomyces macrogynus ATCC 38327]|eukprot:KNE63614.1 hypothetical protein AMAG_08715 [Allomyces macrogynus ATCC 38327]
MSTASEPKSARLCCLTGTLACDSPQVDVYPWEGGMVMTELTDSLRPFFKLTREVIWNSSPEWIEQYYESHRRGFRTIYVAWVPADVARAHLTAFLAAHGPEGIICIETDKTSCSTSTSRTSSRSTAKSCPCPRQVRPIGTLARLPSTGRTPTTLRPFSVALTRRANCTAAAPWASLPFPSLRSLRRSKAAGTLRRYWTFPSSTRQAGSARRRARQHLMNSARTRMRSCLHTRPYANSRCTRRSAISTTTAFISGAGTQRRLCTTKGGGSRNFTSRILWRSRCQPRSKRRWRVPLAPARAMNQS